MISLSYSVSLILKQSCEWHVKWCSHVTLVSSWLAVSLRVVHYLGFITAFFFFLLQMLNYEVQETTRMWQNEKMQTQCYLEMPVLWFSWWPSPPCSRCTKPLYLFSGGLVAPSPSSVMPCSEQRDWFKMIAWGCLFLSKSFLTTKPGSHSQSLPWILRT